MQIGPDVRYIEADVETFDIQVVMDLLRKGHAGLGVAYVIRGAISADVAGKVGTNFRRIIASEGSQRAAEDVIKADQIGSTQFKKSGEEYASYTSQVQPTMLSLFEGLTADEASCFMLDDQLREGFLSHGLHFGPARFKSTYSNYCTIRAWLNNGEMSLQPHEDTSQVEAARADEFEIQRTGQNVLSFNMCVSHDGPGGDLRVWDLRPSEDTRRSVGLYETGYPYPIDFVDGLRSITIDLQPGDAYFLSASFLHGVHPGDGERITAGRFMGLSEKDRRVMFWT